MQREVTHRPYGQIVKPADTMVRYVNSWRVVKAATIMNWHRRLYSRERILQMQRENLRRLLRYAVARCPFYAEQVRGKDPDNLDIRDFRPVDKALLMENFDRIVTDPAATREEAAAFVADPERVGQLFLGRYVASHTSGSSGLRGIFLSDQWAWEMGQALSLTSGGQFPRFKFRDWLRVAAAPVAPLPAAAVIPMQGHYASVLIPRIMGSWTRRVVDINLLEITDPFQVIVDRLNEINPFGLHSYPSMLDILARFRERGELNINPPMITAGGEPFTDDIMRKVKRAWPGVVVYDIYAATEVLGLAKTCNEGTYHLNEDWILVENVDGDGRPVPPGERGDKIYVTSLYNYLMPLVRYEMTDSLIFNTEPCACGMPTVGIKILGRTNHTLHLPGAQGGSVVILPTPLLVAFMDVPGLRQYQIVQEKTDRLHVNFVPEDGRDAEQVRAEIVRVFGAYLKKHGARENLKLTFTQLPEIPRDHRTHKVMQIINKVAA
ncbi:MAG: hypothetical protein M5R36_25350 [Deltaproteobacteria bacterium]|nr:hypothetical protein [Deltaproteobacteria bacterium]